MSHAKNKFVKASNQGSEPNAERFSEILKEFFMRDRKYDDAGLTPKERFQERQSLATKELLIELRSLLDSELTKDSEFRSQYYKKLSIIWTGSGKRSLLTWMMVNYL